MVPTLWPWGLKAQWSGVAWCQTDIKNQTLWRSIPLWLNILQSAFNQLLIAQLLGWSHRCWVSFNTSKKILSCLTDLKGKGSRTGDNLSKSHVSGFRWNGLVLSPGLRALLSLWQAPGDQVPSVDQTHNKNSHSFLAWHSLNTLTFKVCTGATLTGFSDGWILREEQVVGGFEQHIYTHICGMGTRVHSNIGMIFSRINFKKWWIAVKGLEMGWRNSITEWSDILERDQIARS